MGAILNKRGGYTATRTLFLAFLFFIGCSPANLGELRSEAEAEMKKMTLELRKLETSEDVHKSHKRLKKRFNRIANLLIQTRNFPPSSLDSIESLQVGEELFVELARIYEIPGGRAAIEAAESEAVRRLDRSRKAY